MKLFKYCEVYAGGPKGSKPTMDKDWFVYYFFALPGSDPVKWERFVIKDGINRLKSVKERMEYAKNMMRVQDRLLDNGFNPFLGPEKMGFLTIKKGVELALSKKEWSPGSRRIMKGICDIFIDSIGSKAQMDVKKLTRTIAREMLEDVIATRKLGNLSFNRYREVMTIIFNELLDRDKIEFNPFVFKGKKRPLKDDPEPFTDEEIRRIREYLAVKDPPLLRFLRMINHTAIRPGELLRLKAEHVDLINWRITVPATEAKDRQKRIVVVPIGIREDLKLHVREGCYLFGKGLKPEKRNKPYAYQGFHKKWQIRIVRDLGINKTPYLLKHMGISTMLGEMNSKAAQYQAGHSSQKMTDIYSRKDATIFKDELEKFEGNL